MNFDVHEAIEILERTPDTLNLFLSGLSDGWLHSNEGKDTWNAEEVVGHLIESEKSNWIQRMEIILNEGQKGEFPPFDRFSHLSKTSETTLDEKLKEFKNIRVHNIKILKGLIDSDLNLELAGMHPAFGEVKLRELLSTWVVHDFTHIAQIVRVMAKRYRDDVGPWIEFLSILKEKSN